MLDAPGGSAPALGRSVPVRHGQTLDYDGLLREAQEAMDVSGRTQASVAAALGVKPPSVNRALRVAGPRYAQLQGRIIEEVTGYRIEDRSRVEFRVVGKGRG